MSSWYLRRYNNFFCCNVLLTLSSWLCLPSRYIFSDKASMRTWILLPCWNDGHSVISTTKRSVQCCWCDRHRLRSRLLLPSWLHKTTSMPSWLLLSGKHREFLKYSLRRWNLRKNLKTDCSVRMHFMSCRFLLHSRSNNSHHVSPWYIQYEWSRLS